MSRLRMGNDCLYIIIKNKRRIGLAVKNKNKLMFGIRLCNALQGFVGKPTNAFKFALEQKSGIDRDAHYFLTMVKFIPKNIISRFIGLFFQRSCSSAMISSVFVPVYFAGKK